jgi:hypothetical protein
MRAEPSVRLSGGAVILSARLMRITVILVSLELGIGALVVIGGNL